MHNSDEFYYTHQGAMPPLSPWSSTYDSPPLSAPPTWSASPATASYSHYPHPHSHSHSWGAPSPYNTGQSNATPGHAWADPPKSPPWASNTPARPTNSAFGQPVSPGFFGAGNQLPGSPDPSNPWNGMIRSTSEQLTAAPPYMTPADRPWELSRSKSAGADYKRSHTPSRTPIPSHRLPDTLGSANLAKRPKDWRANYNPRASFLSSIPGLHSSKYQSDVAEYTDSTKRRPSSLMEYNPSHPLFSHDLRFDPLHQLTLIKHVNQGEFRNPLSTIELSQFAVTPATNYLRVFHPRLPWYIDIHSDPDNITVADVLGEIHAQLMQPILPRHYWNEALTHANRDEIALAYDRRVTLLNSGRENGILWIDFLCDEVIFQGLTRAKGGLLEMKTRKAYVT
ncbi:hypothetical protein AGABI2DRAFT_213197 [Agaricus bisporus var. bisporus H97]|uniref:hypothetical protein n=1 Tax=Agaricus bisporus var. bisporus (strain H97 / ATCC MYA-4626 / FGSC 10389) TaxID=936046 RepID=UPI00029F5A70|nr:hypothetical protein AGABI2DRAFT_213197 [Agaricus bisporus var. bisporus H97]EKV41681.1 hypothetical protein AGABI2DRAFT_213197 [Agaricus bisporus var. bisporus H97]